MSVHVVNAVRAVKTLRAANALRAVKTARAAETVRAVKAVNAVEERPFRAAKEVGKRWASALATVECWRSVPESVS